MKGKQYFEQAGVENTLLSISLSSVKKFCHYGKLSWLEMRMTLTDTKFFKEEVTEQPEKYHWH